MGEVKAQMKPTGWINAEEIATFVRWLETHCGFDSIDSIDVVPLITAFKLGKCFMVIDRPDGQKELRIL